MSLTYDEIISKADLSLADLTSGGKLADSDSTTFFRKIFEAPTILNEARMVSMPSETHNIHKLFMDGRMLRSANQGSITSNIVGNEGTRALSRADRYKPTTSKISLTAKEVIAEINIPYEFFEDNIEGEGFKNTLLGEMAKRAATDLEEKIILGDTASADAYLALGNGILKETVSRVVNNNGASISPVLFDNMLQSLPAKYHAYKNSMRFYVSTLREQTLRAALANRPTNFGDASLVSNLPINMYGVNVAGVNLMPNNNCVLMNPQNLIVGFKRGITMEFDRNIQERVWIVVLTMRIAHRFEEEDMVVKAINIA